MTKTATLPKLEEVTSVFDAQRAKFFPHRYNASIVVACLAGGVPSNDKIAEGYIKSKIADNDDLVRQRVAEVMLDRGISADDAAAADAMDKYLVGFRRDDAGLFIPGRNIKSCIKEAASIAMNAGSLKPKGWGTTSKTLPNWLPEHVFVLEDKVHIGATEPTGIAQSFPKSFRGTSIQYTEYVENAELSFTVVTDWEITDEQWAALWLTAEMNGVGASRSQGYGTFKVTRWERGMMRSIGGAA